MIRSIEGSFAKVGILDSQSQGQHLAANESSELMTADQSEARVTGLLTLKGDCSESELEDVTRNPVCNLQHLARHEDEECQGRIICIEFRPKIHVLFCETGTQTQRFITEEWCKFYKFPIFIR